MDELDSETEDVTLGLYGVGWLTDKSTKQQKSGPANSAEASTGNEPGSRRCHAPKRPAKKKKAAER